MAAASSVSGALLLLTSPAGVLGLLAAALWAPVTGMATWPALARGRIGSTLVISLAVGVFVFVLARRFGAATWR